LADRLFHDNEEDDESTLVLLFASRQYQSADILMNAMDY
jgi:hypothetical protein